MELPNLRSMRVHLTHPLVTSLDAFKTGAFKTIEIVHGHSQSLKITLHRTVRVPDNTTSYKIPPDCGTFPIYSVAEHTERFPASLVQKGGILVPIYQREAMWINFACRAPFAVKIYAGGVNVISGKPKTKPLFSQPSQGELVSAQQDYIVPPHQHWLDGIATSGGTVSQFVAVSAGSGYSVEAQVTGADSIAGLQFEVISSKLPRSYYGSLSLNIWALTGKRFVIETHSLVTVDDLKFLIQAREGPPPDQQKLLFAGEFLVDGRSLADYNLKSGSVIHLTLRLRGGGTSKLPIRDRPEQKLVLQEMAIAPGGLIKQNIVADPTAAENWELESVVMFNLQLFNAGNFGSLGLPVPSTPITAQTYAKYGYPFFKMYEEPSGISGTFPVVSVGDLDKALRKNSGTHEQEKNLKFPSQVIYNAYHQPSKTTMVKLNTTDEMSKFIPIRLKKKGAEQ